MVGGGGGESDAEPGVACLAVCALRLLEDGSMTVPLPNAWLKQHGVGREVKRRALRDLEAAGLITVERTDRKSPLVTLVML